MYHFSIRELIGITLIVGLCLGWYLDHRQTRVAMHKVVLLREALQHLLYEHEEQTGRRVGIHLEDGEFVQGKAPPPGILLGGSS